MNTTVVVMPMSNPYVSLLSLEWRKDGQKLRRGYLNSSSNPLTLTLPEVEAIDVGLYECVYVSDETTEFTSAASIYLYVSGPVKIAPPKKTRYVNVVVERNETLLPCR